MQSETADFAPGVATWRTVRNIRVVFDSGPFAPLCEKMTWFLRYASGKTDRQTQRHADRNISHPCRGRSNSRVRVVAVQPWTFRY